MGLYAYLTDERRKITVLEVDGENDRRKLANVLYDEGVAEFVPGDDILVGLVLQ